METPPKMLEKPLFLLALLPLICPLDEPVTLYCYTRLNELTAKSGEIYEFVPLSSPVPGC